MFVESQRTGVHLHENGVQEQWDWSQWTEPRLPVQTGLSIPESSTSMRYESAKKPPAEMGYEELQAIYGANGFGAIMSQPALAPQQEGDRCEILKSQIIECSVSTGAELTVASSEIRFYQALVSDLSKALSGGEYQEKSTGNCTKPHKTATPSVSKTETSIVLKCKNLQNNEEKK
ncbi:hypothetical protein HGM15179_016450 [Zosterops borbonicus]|uniref:Uncharacterized protein n=1 Tax=Zosterops borbonicus TaxID=364589 RepID=A0A8K1G2X4_9PASS|nr:hypothetical protein HGM15179_016450 [Zosterops borbonicus]